MSAVPPIYTPATNFATEAMQPITVAGLPGAEMDAEFTGIQSTLGAVRSRLSEIQRDDGLIRNGIVSIDALSSAAIQALGSNSFNVRGAWVANRAYAVGDVFSNGQETRLVKTAYTSGATYNLSNIDTNNTSVLGMPPDVGSVTRKTFNGNGSTTVFTLDVAPIYDTNIRVYVNGLFQLAGTNWTLSGTTLTFAVAPSAGTNNIVTEVGQVSEVDVPVLPASSVGTTQLANLSVTTAKIADSAVTTAKIPNAAITTVKIADANITTAKILDANVTTAKIANAAITSAKIVSGGVVNASIQNGAVDIDKLAPGAVSTSKIVDYAVTSMKIEDGAINSLKITDGEVTREKLATHAVDTDQLAESAVTSVKIENNAVISSKIPNGAITGAKLSGAQTGDAPVFGARAWATFNGVTTSDYMNGTYSQSGNIVTVNINNHGFRVGDSVSLDFTTGSSVDGLYLVTVATQNGFLVTLATSVTTSGNVTLRKMIVHASGNVHSVVGGIGGIYAVNFTTPMESTSYALMGACIGYDSNSIKSGVAVFSSSGSTNWAGPPFRKTINSVVIAAGDIATSTINIAPSPSQVYLAVFG